MYLYFTIGFAVITVLVDLYFFRFLKKQFEHSAKRLQNIIRWSFWSFTAFSVFFYGVASYYYLIQIPPPVFARTFISGFIFIVLVSKLIGLTFFILDDIKSLISYLLKKFGNPKVAQAGSKISRASFIRKTGIIATALPFTGLMYGVVKSAYDFRVLRKNFYSPRLPVGLGGLSIVQISDIHTGSFLKASMLSSAVKMINDLHPDIIFFTGDLVNERSEEAIPFIHELKQFESKLGVYSILGNHDYGDYYYRPGDQEGRKHNRTVMKQIHEELGWNLMLNSHKILEFKGQELGITGVENWGKSARFQKYGDLDLSLSGARPDIFNILLSHDPSHWDNVVKNYDFPFDLTLSGHTHGFQMGIEIPGYIKWSPSQYMYEQWAGLYAHEEKQIYVNRGLGFLGYPGRLGILPEITYLVINPEAV